MDTPNDQTNVVKVLVLSFLCLVWIIIIDPLYLWGLLGWLGINLAFWLVCMVWIFVLSNVVVLAYMLHVTTEEKPMPITTRKIGRIT